MVLPQQNYLFAVAVDNCAGIVLCAVRFISFLHHSHFINVIWLRILMTRPGCISPIFFWKHGPESHQAGGGCCWFQRHPQAAPTSHPHSLSGLMGEVPQQSQPSWFLSNSSLIFNWLPWTDGELKPIKEETQGWLSPKCSAHFWK